MTPNELRERMILIIADQMAEWRAESPEDWRQPSEWAVDALLVAGAAEQWVMPWMEETNARQNDAGSVIGGLTESAWNGYPEFNVPLYRMKEPT